MDFFSHQTRIRHHHHDLSHRIPVHGVSGWQQRLQDRDRICPALLTLLCLHGKNCSNTLGEDLQYFPFYIKIYLQMSWIVQITLIHPLTQQFTTLGNNLC